MPYKDPERQKRAQHEYYENEKAQSAERSKLKRKADKDWLDNQKRRPCMDCGGEFPPVVMDFHHRNPAEKVMSIANAIQRLGRQRVIDEIAKCDMICANCHRIREWITTG